MCRLPRYKLTLEYDGSGYSGWQRQDNAPSVQEALEKAVPTAVFGATQPIQSRVEELISGVRATLALKLYGEDLATLDRLTAQLKGVLETVPGVADLSAEANKGKPQLVIKVDRAAASRFGINADDILNLSACAFRVRLRQIHLIEDRHDLNA